MRRALSGCVGPVAVQVDPRGDLVYVLCELPSELMMYHAVTLDFLGGGQEI